MRQPGNPTGNHAPSASIAAQIVENNSELTAQIVKAINLSNIISGLTRGGAGTAGALALLNNNLAGLQNLDRLVAKPSAGRTSAAAAATVLPTAAPTLTAQPPVAATAATLPNHLLSLLSSNSLLTPSELALLVSDPSVSLLPTPFAPGTNAKVLQQQGKTTTPAAAPVVAIPAISPAAAAAAVAYQQQQAALLQQLQLPIINPLAFGYPPALINGLGVAQLNLLAGIPTLAPGLGAIPGLTPAIAGIPAAGLALPGVAVPGIPAGLNLPEVASTVG